MAAGLWYHDRDVELGRVNNYLFNRAEFSCLYDGVRYRSGKPGGSKISIVNLNRLVGGDNGSVHFRIDPLPAGKRDLYLHTLSSLIIN